MQVKIKKLHPDAKVPTYGSAGAACFDICVLKGGAVPFLGRSAIFETGLAFEVPEGYALMAYNRSGHGIKHGVRLSNLVGILDSDYRGQLLVRLHNDGPDTYQVQDGERVIQAMIVPVPKIEFVEVDELGETERGTGGIGSTGR